jgi:hypothetical protein
MITGTQHPAGLSRGSVANPEWKKRREERLQNGGEAFRELFVAAARDRSCGEILKEVEKLSKREYAAVRLDAAKLCDRRVEQLDALVNYHPPVTQSANGEKPAGIPRSLGDLLDEVVKVLVRFVIFPMDEQPIVIALWVVHTWVLDAFDFTPYLHIFSAETISGKTRLLEVLECLVNKAWKIDSVSVAALFRKIDREWPTLLYDEIDNVFRGGGKDDDIRDLRACLNSGFKRGGRFTRCVGQNANLDTKDFATFCPKALAGIGNRLSDTLSNRCVPIELERQDEVKAAPFRDEQAKALSELRADIEAWGQQPGLTDTLRAKRPTLPQELSDRQMDICAPLLAIADLAGGDWPQKVRKAVTKLCTSGDTVISIGVQLLTDIKRIFDETGLDKIATKELLEKLVEIEESPWPLMFEDALKHDRLRTAAAKLAKRLKPYKAPGGERIEPRSIKLPDGSVQRGYHRDDFKLAWKRYLPRIPATDATNATSATSTYEKAGSMSELGSVTRTLPERQTLPDFTYEK